MAILELVQEVTVRGQITLNRFHLQTPDVGTPYAGFAEAVRLDWFTNLQAHWRNLLSADTGTAELTGITVRSLYDETDFAESSHALPGTRTGQCLPPNWVAAVRSPRMRTGWNRAYKRISGMSESDVTGNEPVQAWLTNLGNFVNALLPGRTIVTAGQTDVLIRYVMLRLDKEYNAQEQRWEYFPFASETTQRQNSVVVPALAFYRFTGQRSRLPEQGV